MKILSPAKINLMLRVLGQREDGYHLLQTYFQLLDWGDYMQFEPQNQGIEVHGEFNNLPLQDNLIYQAAKLLQPYSQQGTGIKINVNKNIPQGSGLGGGSSNAGTTLRILNKIWQCSLSNTELQKLAIQLGADVPIFVLNHAAMATGVGEKLQVYKIDTNYYFVLIFPPVSITTTEVFNYPNLNRNQQPIDLTEINSQDNWTNTCLQPVLDQYPQLKTIYQQAAKYAKIYMSGTGSTLFASFENQTDANNFIQQCPRQWQTQLCNSLHDSK